MITTTWTAAPADLLGLGGVRRASRAPVSTAAPSSASAPRRASLRSRGPVCPPAAPLRGCAADRSSRPSLTAHGRHRSHHNSIGTTLGFHSLEETAELTARPVLLEAAEPEPRDPRPFSLSAAPGTRPPVGGPPPAVADEERGGAAVQQTIDRPTSHRRPGLPWTGGSPPRRPHTPVAPAPVRRPLPCRVEDPELWFAETPGAARAGQELLRRLPGPGRLPGRRAGPRPSPGASGAARSSSAASVIARKRPRGRPRKVVAA